MSEPQRMPLSFREIEDDLSAELAAARAWVAAHLDALVQERRRPERNWLIRYGCRYGGGRLGVPVISQYGFLIEGRAPGPRAPDVDPLTCFLIENDVTDEESRTLAANILALWLDRLD